MQEKIKTIYVCDHCGKKYFVKWACEKHEKACFYNPENSRPCSTCSNLTKKTTLVDGYNGNDRQVSLFYCKVKKIFLYPPQVEIKGNAFFPEEDNYPMPKECDVKENSLDMGDVDDLFSGLSTPWNK